MLINVILNNNEMERSNSNESYQQTKPSFLFVGGLSLEASARDVGQHFELFGTVTKVDLPLSRGGQRKGFGFVHFSHSESVSIALEEPYHEIKGKRVAVRVGMDDSQASVATKNMQERKIYATGFTDWTSEEDVFRIFSSFGKVTRILSPRGGIGKRGFCYIIMKEKQDFDNLCLMGSINFNNKEINLSPAQIKSKVKEASDNLSGSRRSSFQASSSSSQRMIPSKPGVEAAKKQESSTRTIPQARPSSFSSNLTGVHRGGRPNNSSCIGQNNLGMKQSIFSRPQFTAEGHWYSPFAGVNTNSFYQYADKIRTKQNITNLSESLLPFGGDDVEIEIVQDISTTVTIRHPGCQTAVRATFDEHNTYSGIF